MPYIDESMQQNRVMIMANENDPVSLEQRVGDLIHHIRTKYTEEEREGVVNYTISRIVAGVMRPETGWRYKWLNRAHGTFLSAAAEFYRRLVGPYEDKCIANNGDIPEYELADMSLADQVKVLQAELKRLEDKLMSQTDARNFVSGNSRGFHG